jgi:arsenate reductase
MTKILFACVHSAGRSQMAAAFFNSLTRSGEFESMAVGTHPAIRIHPQVVQVMLEIGFDLSRVKPVKIENSLVENATLVVTMGCEVNCPLISGVEHIDWKLKDPKGKTRAEVIAIRDEIHSLVSKLVSDRHWGKLE